MVQFISVEQLLTGFLEERHSLGYSYKTEEGVLRRFLKDFTMSPDGKIEFTKKYVLEHTNPKLNSDFSFLLTRYLTHYLPVQRNLSSNTIRSYRDTFKQLLEFCRDEKNINIIRLTIHQVDKKCIEDFFLWLQKCREISPSTYNQRLCAVHAFFEYIMMEKPEYMEHCRQILKIPNLKAPKPSAKYLTTDALKSILAAPDTTTKQGRRHLVILTVLYDTAARVSELSDIRIKDVRLEYPSSITLHGKGHKVRTVPIMKQTTALLKEYFNENRINSQIHSDMKRCS